MVPMVQVLGGPDGSQAVGWPAFHKSTMHASPLLYDIDFDGVRDVLLATYDGEIVFVKDTVSTVRAAGRIQKVQLAAAAAWRTGGRARRAGERSAAQRCYPCAACCGHARKTPSSDQRATRPHACMLAGSVPLSLSISLSLSLSLYISLSLSLLAHHSLARLQGEIMAERITLPRLRVRKEWYVGLNPDPLDHSHPDVGDEDKARNGTFLRGPPAPPPPGRRGQAKQQQAGGAKAKSAKPSGGEAPTQAPLVAVPFEHDVPPGMKDRVLKFVVQIREYE